MLRNGRGIWKLRAMPRCERWFGGSAVMSSPANSTATIVRPQRAGDAIDQRGLAGAVRSDQAEALALADFDVDIVQRDEAAKVLGQSIDPQQRGF